MIFPARPEVLETRLTPSALIPIISADGKKATFVDADGDIFNVTTSKGKFTAANFTYTGDLVSGQGYLQKIDLGFALFGKMFQGAKITVTVDQVVGDGFADVGVVNAAGIDLKQVAIDGDLVRIDVGDGNVSTPAIGLLHAAQLGFHTIADAGVSDFISRITGGIERLDVGDWADASIQVAGGTTPKTEKFGSVGKAFIGTITGGSDPGSGTLRATGALGTVVVQGFIQGGDADQSGSISSAKKIGSISVGGDVIGGGGAFSGSILTGNEGSIGTLVIGGSVQGGSALGSGSISTGGTIKSATVNGSVIGGTDEWSGSILAGAARSITIMGALTGASGPTGVFIEGVLGRLSVGSVDAAGGPAYITAGGPVSGGIAIEKISVTGSMEDAKVLAGYTSLLEPANANARIGRITIGGDLLSTDILAGIDRVNGIAGDSDDQVISTDTKPKFLSSIGAISVGGIIEGTDDIADQFAILAERIGSLTVGGVKTPLNPKGIDDLQLGTKGDYRLREIVHPT